MSYLTEKVQQHKATYPHGENSTKQKYSPWVDELLENVSAFVPHAAKFDAELKQLLDALDYSKMIERCEMANNYFVPKLEAVSDFVLNHIVAISSEKGIKAYQEELLELESDFYQQIIKLHKLTHSIKAVIYRKDDLPSFTIKSASERMSRIKDLNKSMVKDHNEKYQ